MIRKNGSRFSEKITPKQKVRAGRPSRSDETEGL
jgi:hypothetical protein